MFHRVLAVGRRVATSRRQIMDSEANCRTEMISAVIHRQAVGWRMPFASGGVTVRASSTVSIRVMSLPDSPSCFDLRMAGMSDQKDMFALRGMAPCLNANLGHQRTVASTAIMLRLSASSTTERATPWRKRRLPHQQDLVEFLDEDGKNSASPSTTVRLCTIS